MNELSATQGPLPFRSEMTSADFEMFSLRCSHNGFFCDLAENSVSAAEIAMLTVGGDVRIRTVLEQILSFWTGVFSRRHEAKDGRAGRRYLDLKQTITV